MKPIHFLAPVLALAGSAYWLNARQDTIRELTEKTRVIRERVVLVDKVANEAPADPFAKANPDAPDEFTLPDGSLNWKMIAEIMAESRGSNGMPTNIKTMLKLQQKLMAMEEADLIDGLQKITTLDLDPEVTAMLRSGLLQQLSQKDPVAALQALGDPITSREDSSGLYWMQGNLLAKVAKDNPAAAIAWMDKMIADGKLQSTSLESHNDIRLRLEGSLIANLVGSDYEAAKSRLEGYTTDEKAILLTNNYKIFEKNDSANFLKLARESLPPEAASNAITNALGNQHHKDLSSISDSLKKVSLSDSEKSQVVENLIGNYARNNNSDNKYQEIYEWSQTEAPGQEVALVTKALVNGRNRWGDPQSGFKEALAISESLQQPEILTGFVADFSNNGNENTVKQQLEKFKDPALAEQYQTLVNALPKTDNTIEASELFEGSELELEIK